MSISSVGAGAMFALRAATGAGSPSSSAQPGRVNTQADLVQAMMNTRLPAVTAAHLSDGTGVDLYM
jgi:hypothetical protein